MSKSQTQACNDEAFRVIVTLDDGTEVTEFTAEEAALMKAYPISAEGENNVIRFAFKERGDIAKFFSHPGVTIVIYGNDNTINFGRNLYFYVGSVLNLTGLRILIGNDADPFNSPDEMRYASRCTVSIGENTTFCGATFFCQDDDSRIVVGRNTMFSWGIDVWCTDIHTISGMDGVEQNFGKSIEIGEHVWVGRDVKIGKNTRIPADSVVGWSSVVTKKFDEPNVIIAGNPAKVVKRQIKWDRRDLQNYARRRREHLLAQPELTDAATGEPISL